MQICWVGCHSKIFWIMDPDLVNKSIFEENEKHALLVIGADAYILKANDVAGLAILAKKMAENLA